VKTKKEEKQWKSAKCFTFSVSVKENIAKNTTIDYWMSCDPPKYYKRQLAGHSGQLIDLKKDTVKKKDNLEL
jgi:hypothetical protein